jgi:hypothetical protein
VAEVALYLASDASAWVSGIVLDVRAGLSYVSARRLMASVGLSREGIT